MKNTLKQLPDDLEQLKEYTLLLQDSLEKIRQENLKIESELKTTRLQYANLLEQFKLSQLRKFGRSSEKNPFQLDMFDEAETKLSEDAKADVAEEIVEETSSAKKKNLGQAKRKPLPDYLPREVREYDITEAEKTCDCCGSQKVCFGKEVSEQLKVIPAKIVVISHQRLKYACKSCEGNISIAPKPAVLLPKSIADASLVAHTIVMKYADHVPLYRQEHIWKRNQVELPRNTTCAWIMKAAELCEPLRKVMWQLMTHSDYIQVDETSVQVLQESGRKNTQKSYMWVYRNAGNNPLILYDYQETRENKHPQHRLTGFKGYIQTDAYKGYDWLSQLTDVIHLGCMAHARRSFAELEKISPNKKTLASEAIQMIGELYRIEADIKDKTDNEKFRQRQEKSKPQLEKIHLWLKQQVESTPPNSKLGKGIRYMLIHWDKLIRYLKDGKLKIDNNEIENAIRPFALGRKNWLFAGHPRGARAGALFYSLIMTARENGLNEHEYLTFILDRIRSCVTDNDYQKLLPGYLSAEEKAALALK